MGTKLFATVERGINAPLEYAYHWLTDFQEDDPQIKGSPLKRKILEKNDKRCIYAVEKVVGDSVMRSQSVVTFSPPDEYYLELTGDDMDVIANYVLHSEGDGTRLKMTFDINFKIGSVPKKEELERDINLDWDKYIEVLEREYNQ